MAVPRDSPKFERLTKSIICQDGCVVIPRDICRRKRIAAVSVIDAMRNLSRAQDDPNYLGEYLEMRKSNTSIKTFYKCHPSKLKIEALRALGLTLTIEEYSELFYKKTRHSLVASNSWQDYVQTLMLNCPYQLNLFPLECLGMTDEQAGTLRNQFNMPELEFNMDISTE